jgi:hypothetical protein
MSNFAVVQNGQVVQIVPLDVPFTVGAKTYSGSFLRSSTPAEKLEAGVWEIIHGARPDDKYYWVSGPTYRVNETNSTVEATYAGAAKDLDDLKKNAKAQVRASAYSLLVQTDWMAVKAFETGTTVPADWTTWRAEIRTQAGAAVTAIDAATDIDSLITASAVVWANDPNYVAPVQNEEPVAP